MENRRIVMRESKTKIAFICMILSFFACGCFVSLTGSSKPRSHTPPGYEVRKSGPPSHAPAHGYRKKHSYLYYPNNNVYYSTERKVYFYLGEDGWKMGATLPGSIDLSIEKAVALQLDSDLPYATFPDNTCSRSGGKGKWKKRSR
jgi:hypothetical protein